MGNNLSAGSCWFFISQIYIDLYNLPPVCSDEVPRACQQRRHQRSRLPNAGNLFLLLKEWKMQPGVYQPESWTHCSSFLCMRLYISRLRYDSNLFDQTNSIRPRPRRTVVYLHEHSSQSLLLFLSLRLLLTEGLNGFIFIYIDINIYLCIYMKLVFSQLCVSSRWVLHSDVRLD